MPLGHFQFLLSTFKFLKNLREALENQVFLFEKPLIYVSCTFWPLLLCKIPKKSFEWIQSYVIVPFLGENSPFAPNEFFFFTKTINISSMYLLTSFIVQNSTKYLQQNQSYECVPFLSPKWSICPK